MKVRSQALAFLIIVLLIPCSYLFAQNNAADSKTGEGGQTESSSTTTPPDLGIYPLQISFPPQRVAKTSTAQRVTLTNKGKEAITIAEIGVSGDFSIAPATFPLKLEGVASRDILVSFTPKQEGAAAGILTIASTASSTPQVIALSGDTSGPLPWLCSASLLEEVSLIAILCVLYWLAMVIVRWNRIARPSRELLKAEITAMGVELDTLYPKAEGLDNLKTLLQAAEALINRATNVSGYGIVDFIFWSRGQETTGWGYIHEAQIQGAQFLPEPTLMARLGSAEQQLRLTTDAPSLVLANAIHQATGAPPADLAQRRALLAEALSVNYRRDENSYADLVSWQNKTSWLVGCGLIFILALTGVIQHHSILFLVGGLGGLLSRLSRSLNRKDVPTDYGASWTTLFLSPVAGALGAWAGILLTGFAVKLSVLGSAFAGDWVDSCNPTTLAIALVFGFSERLFDSVLDKVEAKGLGDQTTTTTNPPPPKPGAIPAVAAVPPDAGNDPGSAGGTLTITAPGLPEGTVGTPYSWKLTATGAKGDVTWSRTQGDLPPGLTLGADGVVSGNPTTAGPFKLIVAAKDQGLRVTREITITIKPAS